MDLSELKSKKLPTVPPEIVSALASPHITLTPFEEKNDVLSDPALRAEAGYGAFRDGSYLVSMYCLMPGLTAEMVSWWFWWHPRSKERYQAWFPGAHYGISYPRRCAGYFERESRPPFQDNTQLPTEKIGGMRMPLRIDFVTPGEFGFSEAAMSRHAVPLIVCGHVGAFNGLIWHTDMAHIFFQRTDGLFLASRFWLGRTMNPLLRPLMINDAMARGMAEHCAVEYRNLAEILPGLYERYGNQPSGGHSSV